MLADEPAVQPASLLEPENRAAYARRVVLGTAENRRSSGEEQAREHHVVGDDFAQRPAERGGQAHVREWRLSAAARDRAEVAIKQSPHLVTVEVSRDREDGIVGSVICREELLDVLETRLIEVAHRADQRVVEWVTRGKAERG